MNTIGNYAPDFEIPGIDQEVYHLGRYCKTFKAISVVFMGNVPEVKPYLERLKKIQAEFESQRFTIMGIDSNHYSRPIAESIEAMQKFAESQELNFPYLRDSNQDVAISFGAKVLPTAYLLDSKGVIRYHGKIDDGSESLEQVNHHYLRDCIAAFLSGRTITKDYIEPIGIDIKWREDE